MLSVFSAKKTQVLLPAVEKGGDVKNERKTVNRQKERPLKSNNGEGMKGGGGVGNPRHGEVRRQE